MGTREMTRLQLQVRTSYDTFPSSQNGCGILVIVQSCGESVIASEARQSRWRKGVLPDRRGCYGVEIATAQAPRNDNLLHSEQLRILGRIDRVGGRAYHFWSGRATRGAGGALNPQSATAGWNSSPRQGARANFPGNGADGWVPRGAGP